MLNHSNPAVIRLCLEIFISVGDVRKTNLLELILIGVDSSTGISVDHSAFAFRFFTVTGQLVVNRRLDLGCSVVNHFMRNFDAVMTAFERKALNDLNTAGFAFELNGKIILPVSHLKRAGDQFKLSLVRRVRTAD